MRSSRFKPAHGWHFASAALILAVYALLAACSPKPPTPATESRTLEPGQAVSTVHEPAVTVSYVFDAVANHTYLARIGQDDADVVVEVEGPGGITLTVDTLFAGTTPEFVLLDHARAGTYRLSIVTSKSSKPEISHNVLVSDLGTDFDGDESLVEAAQLMSSATVSYWIIWDWDRAAGNAAKAAEVYASAGYPELRADAIMFEAAALAETIYSAGDPEDVLDEIAALLDDSYETHDKLGNTARLAKVRYYNGLALQYAGQDEAARAFYDEALSLYGQVDDWREERYVHLNLAVMEIVAGNSATAIQALNELHRIDEQRLPDLPGPSDKNFVATVQDQLGYTYADIGAIDEALWAYFSAAEKHAEVDDQHGVAESLRGLAQTYLRAGDVAEARQFVDRARHSALESSNGRIIAGLIGMVGDMMYTTGDYQSAREFQVEALDLAAPEGAVRVNRQIQLARTLNALHDYQQAGDMADVALQGAKAMNAMLLEAGALHETGGARLGLGRPAQSVAALEEALALYGRLGRSAEQADTAFALARSLSVLASDSDNDDSRDALLDQAQRQSEDALQHVEWALTRVSDPELRSRLAATRRSYFHSHIGLLMNRYEESNRSDVRFVSAALATSERARARMTMNLLNEASVNLQESVDPAITEEMYSLRNRLVVRERQRNELQDSGATDERAAAKLRRLEKEIADIRVQFDLKQVALRQGNEAYRALAAPETIGVEKLQALVDEDSVVIQYFLGEHRSFAWVVTHDSIEAVELADRATIEAAAESAFSALGNHNYTREAVAAQRQHIMDVSDLVLKPVAPLVGDKRLIIVADGALHYLPFQTLAMPSDSDDETRMLVHSHEVVALPSMSVLAALRARKSAAHAQKSAAVFADPVFETSDPRYVELIDEGNVTVASVQNDEHGETGTDARGVAQLSRLAGTSVEASAIAALVPAENLLLKTGLAANRNAVLHGDLSGYRYVHFATHGSVNRESPALSSLVLSQFDINGIPQDGHLRLHDIYRLRIDADLVVLSACKTGSGTDIDGEGLIGLAQGFFYAGARSMVVSLWDVPDMPTSELMKRFYYEILEEGRTPAAALRAAQLSVAADPRWKDPYYWSAFVLLGDWQ